MTVEYQQGEAEILALQQRLLGRSPSVQRLIRRQRYGYSLVFVALGLILGALNPAQRMNVWLGALAFALIWVAFYPQLVVRTLKSSSRKLVQQAREQGLLGRQVLTLDQSGIQMRNDLTEATYPWRSVEEVAESEQHVFLHVGPSKAYAVPKAAFADAGAVDQFLRICAEHRSHFPSML